MAYDKGYDDAEQGITLNPYQSKTMSEAWTRGFEDYITFMRREHDQREMERHFQEEMKRIHEDESNRSYYDSRSRY